MAMMCKWDGKVTWHSTCLLVLTAWSSIAALLHLLIQMPIKLASLSQQEKTPVSIGANSFTSPKENVKQMGLYLSPERGKCWEICSFVVKFCAFHS